jgi:phage shock protein E
MLPTIALTLLCLAFGAFAFFAFMGKTSGKDARRLVAEGARLLDVRTPSEFAQGHLPGALNMPVQELENRLDELGVRSRPLVVYCRSGSRSGSAKRVLERHGFIAVHDLGAMGRFDD